MRKISRIHITDTFGTESAKFSPGSVTRLRGRNGSGKSSVLRALGKIFEGGHDPSQIRRGAEKSVVEIVLDDGTTITRTCAPVKRRKGENPDLPTRYNTSVEITDADGTARPAPQTFIKELGEASAIDPGEILRIDTTLAPGRKQLAEILLRIMPIEFAAEEILGVNNSDYRAGATTRIKPGLVLPEVTGTLGLDGLKTYVGKIIEQRRRIGQTRDDSDGAMNRLRKSLPEEDGIDYASALAGAEERKTEIDTAIQDRKSEIEEAKNVELRAAETAAHEANAVIDREIEAAILELEKQRAARKQEAQKALAAARAKVTEIVANELQVLANESKQPLEEVVTDIAKYKEKRDAQLRAETLRQELEIQKTSYHAASSTYDQLSEVLERLEVLRKSKLDSLPVAGLEVTSDTVHVDGVPWQNVNTARRIEVALQLCTLRSGKLGILLLDDAEHLDSETRRMLEEGIVAAGFQLIEAIVSDSDELKIEIAEIPVAA